MSVELEAKVKVDDLQPVREALLSAGAKRVGKVREVNTYFTVDDPDIGLRTRREVDEDGTIRRRVTYKGPKQAGRFKQREEIEFDVSAAAAVAALFERLGHRVALIFEKDRETFTLSGCEVVLDELPELGTFVEVEGPSELEVHSVLERIGLGEAETLTTGYASLIAKHLRGTGSHELRF